MNLSAVAHAGIISALVMRMMLFAIAVKMDTILGTLQILQRFVRNGRRMMENDYIERQGAIKEIQQAVIKGYGTDYGVIDSDVVYEILDDLPAADVVPVVRCKDCRKCIHDSLFGQLWCNMTLVTRRVKPDDFCSYGKRKDGVR